MKKSVTRVLSVLLALVMLLGMTAVAEVERITFDLNGFDGTKLDGILSIGYDEDGCEQFSFVNSVLGKFVLQSDGNDLVFGGDQMGYYVVSADDLVEAISIAADRMSTAGMDESSIAMMNYLNSPAYEQDVEMLADIFSNEINRIAQIAARKGFVAIYENGDLEIAVDVQGVFALISEYLVELSADTDVLSAFAGLEYFKVAQIPMAENVDQLPAILLDAADQVEAAAAEAANEMDGGLKLYVSAETGEMNGNYYASTTRGGVVVYSMNETFKFTEDGMEMNVDIDQEGNIVKAQYVLSEDEIFAEVNAEAAGQNAHLLCRMDENGLVGELTADTYELAGNGKVVIDANGINGSWDYTGSRFVRQGSVNFNASSLELIYKNHCAERTVIKDTSIEYVGGELKAEYTAANGGRTTAEWLITGSDSYQITGKWNDYDGKYELNGTIDTVNNTETFSIDYDGGYTKSHVEWNLSETDTAEKAFVVVSEQNGSYTEKFTIEMQEDYSDGSVSGVFEYDENGDKYPGSFLFNNSLAEIRFSDERMAYRIYAERAQNASDVTLQAGISGEEFANPGTIIDAILFILNADLENGFFGANFSAPMLGNFASAYFDGQIVRLEVTSEDETIVMEGKMVETENAQYLEFTGDVSGVPFEARIGLKMENEYTMCLFAEALANGEKALDCEAHIIQSETEIALEIFGDSVRVDGEKIIIKAAAVPEGEGTVRFYGEITGEVPGHKVGAYLPVTVVQNAYGMAVSAVLSIAQGDVINEIGNAALAYETLPGYLEHVDGERLTSDMLAEMILQFFGVY